MHPGRFFLQILSYIAICKNTHETKYSCTEPGMAEEALSQAATKVGHRRGCAVCKQTAITGNTDDLGFID